MSRRCDYYFSLFCACVILFLFFIICSEKYPVANTKYGKIQGFNHETETGEKVEIYLGIPYAVADRFEKPRAVEPWDGIRKTVEFPKQCPPITEDLVSNEISEDCLGLSLYKPSKKSESPNGYPVLVYIHGGGFVGGESKKYGFKSFAEYFAAHGVLVVSVQYRVGFLGFLSTGDENLPGNLGLWDLAFALEFTRDLVGRNDGNADEITVFGHSAGAAATHALILSPHTSGLFKRVIESSGSLFAEWAFNEAVVNNTFEFAEALGCSRDMDTKEMVQKLKTKSIDEMTDAMRRLGVFKKNMRQFPFNPRFDGDFFPESLEDLAMKEKKIDVMIGVTETEWSKIVNREYNIFNTAGIREEYKSNFTGDRFVEYIDEIILENVLQRGQDENGEVKNLEKALIDRFVTSDSKKNLRNVVDIVSDLMFVLPPIQQIQLRNKFGLKTYLFYELHERQLMSTESEIVPGAQHGNELFYLFDNERGFYTFSEADNVFKRNLIEGFRSFVVDGIPKSDGIEWPDTDNGFRHVALNPGPMIRDNFEEERMSFWLQQLPQKVGLHLLRKTRLPFAQ